MKKIMLIVCAMSALSCMLFAENKKTKTPGQFLDEAISSIQDAVKDTKDDVAEKSEEIKEKTKDKKADLFRLIEVMDISILHRAWQRLAIIILKYNLRYNKSFSFLYF